MRGNSFKEYNFKDLDIIAALIGILFGFLITSLYFISNTVHLLMLGMVLILASFTYLIIKNKEKISDLSIKTSNKLILEIIFFCLISISFLLLLINQNRPLLYFIIISLSSAFLAISIVNVRSKCDIYFQIVKIFLISLNVKYSIFFFYGGSGVDYWEHLKMNNLLSIDGFINVLIGKESFFPLMHIQVAVNQVITNTSIKDATNFAIIIPLIISSICVFLLARDLFDVKIGLFAMLIINVTDFHIYWGAAPQTTTLGICYYYFIIFLIFLISTQMKNRMALFVIILIFIPTLVLTHAVSSFVLFISMVGLLAGSFIYKIIFDKRETFIPSMVIVILFGLVLLQHWLVTLYNQLREETFFETIITSLDYYVTEHADFLNRPEAFSEYTGSLPPLLERAANIGGLTLLLFFAAVGTLFWLSSKYKNKYTFSMIICTIVLLIVTFGFPLFGIRNIIPSRWFVFVYFFLAIMAAFAIFTAFQTFQNARFRVMGYFILVFIFTLMMTTSTISNLDSPLWLKDSTISTAYTFQEVRGAETLSKHSDRIFSDSRYGHSIINDYYGLHTSQLISEDMSDRGGEIFIWRDYMKIRPISMPNTIKGYYNPIEEPFFLDQKFQNKLKIQNKIYANDDIIGYLVNSV